MCGYASQNKYARGIHLFAFILIRLSFLLSVSFSRATSSPFRSVSICLFAFANVLCIVWRRKFWLNVTHVSHSFGSAILVHMGNSNIECLRFRCAYSEDIYPLISRHTQTYIVCYIHIKRKNMVCVCATYSTYASCLAFAS